jgi:hypothetical protein
LGFYGEIMGMAQFGRPLTLNKGEGFYLLAIYLLRPREIKVHSLVGDSLY